MGLGSADRSHLDIIDQLARCGDSDIHVSAIVSDIPFYLVGFVSDFDATSIVDLLTGKFRGRNDRITGRRQMNRTQRLRRQS